MGEYEPTAADIRELRNYAADLAVTGVLRGMRYEQGIELVLDLLDGEMSMEELREEIADARERMPARYLQSLK